MSTSVKEMDAIIHRERIAHDDEKVTHQRLSSDIPEGTFIVMNEEPYLFSNGKLHRWTPFGYENSLAVPEASLLTILTPSSIVNAFGQGYAPQTSLLLGQSFR